MDGAEQVHNGGGAGTAHPEVDDGNVICSARIAWGRPIPTISASFHSAKRGYIITEIGEEDVGAEMLEFFSCVAGSQLATTFLLSS